MSESSSRRDFMKTAALGAAALVSPATARAVPKNPLPHWRGFNLTYVFTARRRQTGPVEIPEDDFVMIRDLGFDWVRIPMDYRHWVDSDWRTTGQVNAKDILKISESGLADVDRIVDLGRKHFVHVNLCFHRGPGYCIADTHLNAPKVEPFDLWRDKEGEDAFVYHWDVFAKRYKGISPAELSFNLINEPPAPHRTKVTKAEQLVVELENEAFPRPPSNMTREDYRRVMTRAVGTIRESSPDRTIIVDGLDVGVSIVPEMMHAKVAQSLHTYQPLEVSHYRANWVDAKSDFPAPHWPANRRDGKGQISRDTLEELYAPWGWLVSQGVGVHAGEAGGYTKTPHPVFLQWMADTLDILKSYNIGFALWNFRGDFGVLDSRREDVAYEDWHGHKLDRELLTLLQYH
jgi:endoglucanase